MSVESEVEALGALNRLKRATLAAVEATSLERKRKLVFIKLARETGWSWVRIANELGVTEPAARRWWKRNYRELRASDVHR